MERVDSERGKDVSGIVNTGRGGGEDTPPPAGLGEAHHGPTDRKPQPLSAEFPPIVSSLVRQRHDKRIFLGAQRFYHHEKERVAGNQVSVLQQTHCQGRSLGT